MITLKRRSEFLRVRGGVRWSTPGFVIEARARVGEAEAREARFGFTVTKQLGKAVTRNRIRRRLREAARLLAPTCATPGHDYVLIARGAALDRDFALLKQDLETAFVRLARPIPAKRPSPAKGRSPDKGQGSAT